MYPRFCGFAGRCCFICCRAQKNNWRLERSFEIRKRIRKSSDFLKRRSFFTQNYILFAPNHFRTFFAHFFQPLLRHNKQFFERIFVFICRLWFDMVIYLNIIVTKKSTIFQFWGHIFDIENFHTPQSQSGNQNRPHYPRGLQ